MLIDVPETLRVARTRFSGFYAGATPAESGVMDAAVLAHAAVVLGARAPRTGLDEAARREIDGATDRIERKLMEYLESLHRTSAFAALDAGSRADIDRALRTVPHD